MTLEKLQTIATTPIKSIYKVKWLGWWNLSDMSHESLRFPLGEAKEANLEKWLSKTSFWAHVNLNLFIVSILSSQLLICGC